MLQAVREADAAVEQAGQSAKQAAVASRHCNAQVSEILADLGRLQQSQRTPFLLFHGLHVTT